MNYNSALVKKFKKSEDLSLQEIITKTVDVVQQIERERDVSPKLSHTLESLLIRVKLLSENSITWQLTFFIECLLLASYKEDVLSVDSAIKFERLLPSVQIKLCSDLRHRIRKFNGFDIYIQAIFHIKIYSLVKGENVYKVVKEGHKHVLLKNGKEVYSCFYTPYFIDLLHDYKSIPKLSAKLIDL